MWEHEHAKYGVNDMGSYHVRGLCCSINWNTPNFASDIHSVPEGLNPVPISIMERFSSEADIVERA